MLRHLINICPLTPAVLLACACSDISMGAERDTEVALSTALGRTVSALRITGGEMWGTTVPGLAAAAIIGEKSHGIVAAVVSGAVDPPGRRPMQESARFHIGSPTKTFTAALIMQLDQEGKLSLDDPISTWINYENAENITIKMLLGHTSGIPNFFSAEGRTPEDSPKDLIELSKSLKPSFAPGSSWEYSNTNYIILGIISEKVTEMTWQEQIESRFIQPLGLTDTYVWTGEPVGPTVNGSRIACSGNAEPECVPPESNLKLLAVTDGFDWKASWAAGAIVSTPADLARWMRSLVSGDVLDVGHRQLLVTPTRQSVQALSGNLAPGEHHGPLRWTGYSLGLCRFEVTGEGIGWGHSGVINGFVSNVVQMMGSGDTVSLTSNFEYFDKLEGLGHLVMAAGEIQP